MIFLLMKISPFWLNHMKYFQNDFDNFYRILDLAFEKNRKKYNGKLPKKKKRKFP